ncbi:MAG: alpha/beta fold hydrolase [Cardiobacteriaceae bacterium]|nr:alpha/beta fold hydrolase [Cardiobacteriaceae bacterium]
MHASRKLVLIHGLFLNRHIMGRLARHFRRRGWQVLTLDYPTTRQTLADTAADWLPRIQAFAAGDSVDAVGHSLGGLLIRHLQAQWPQGFHRVVTLGTPHNGSVTGAYFHGFAKGALIGQAWPHGLDGHAPAWHADIPLLSIAGTKNTGVGSLFGLFRDQAGDGTVTVAETRLAEAAAYCDLPYSHTGMLFAREIADVATAWLGERAHPQIFTDFHKIS